MAALDAWPFGRVLPKVGPALTTHWPGCLSPQLASLIQLRLYVGKFQPPDGGNGGHGGNVVVQACAA